MVIVTFFDHKYFHWAKLLVYSTKIYEPTTKIHISTFNLSNEQKQELEQYPVDAIEHSEIKFDPSISDPYYKQLNRNDPLRFQITHRKGNYLLRAMTRFPNEDLFVLTDIDMILIRPLNKLKQQMQNHDIGFVRVHAKKVMSGFIAARRTKAGIRFLEAFETEILDGRLFLCKCQKKLAKLYNETYHEIEFLLLDRKYLDHTSNENAYFWSAHKSAFGGKDIRYQNFLKKLKSLMENA